MILKCLKPKKGYFTFTLNDVISGNTSDLDSHYSNKELFTEIKYMSLEKIIYEVEDIECKIRPFSDERFEMWHTYMSRAKLTELESSTIYLCVAKEKRTSECAEKNSRWYPELYWNFNPTFIIETKEDYVKILSELQKIYRKHLDSLVGEEREFFLGKWDEYVFPDEARKEPDFWGENAVPNYLAISRGIAFYKMLSEISMAISSRYRQVFNVPFDLDKTFTGEVSPYNDYDPPEYKKFQISCHCYFPSDFVDKIYTNLISVNNLFITFNRLSSSSIELLVDCDEEGVYGSSFAFRVEDFEEETKEMNAF